MTRNLSLLALLLGCTHPALKPPSPPREPPPLTDGAWHASRHYPGITFHSGAGDPRSAGPFVYWLHSEPGVAIGVHRHDADERIRVVSGRKFVLMGNPPESGKVRRVEAGDFFVVPANTWHVEWFETETLEEISGDGPLNTERPPEAYPER